MSRNMEKFIPKVLINMSDRNKDKPLVIDKAMKSLFQLLFVIVVKSVVGSRLLKKLVLGKRLGVFCLLSH